ncbi:hypothetical protein FA13DRAFT_1712327 [Coprinellus micaceus]|uniref:Uncharacterized protein n=1 Tax=Coprinellus micaceus TaxID=71717 RepID=A0A4Y7T0Y4_COPMI|nr:hypothetical protein FA13DRAFT_1712327 [Coprinellus micaceus]
MLAADTVSWLRDVDARLVDWSSNASRGWGEGERISLILRLQRENQGIPSHRSRPKSSRALRKLRRCGRMLRGETVGWCSNKGRIDAGGVNAEALRRGRWLVPRERIILARVKRLRVRGIVRSRLTFDVHGWGHGIHPHIIPTDLAHPTPMPRHSDADTLTLESPSSADANQETASLNTAVQQGPPQRGMGTQRRKGPVRPPQRESMERK